MQILFASIALFICVIAFIVFGVAMTAAIPFIIVGVVVALIFVKIMDWIL